MSELICAICDKPYMNFDGVHTDYYCHHDLYSLMGEITTLRAENARLQTQIQELKQEIDGDDLMFAEGESFATQEEQRHKAIEDENARLKEALARCSPMTSYSVDHKYHCVFCGCLTIERHASDCIWWQALVVFHD
jgi:hypothetical protein